MSPKFSVRRQTCSNRTFSDHQHRHKGGRRQGLVERGTRGESWCFPWQLCETHQFTGIHKQYKCTTRRGDLTYLFNSITYKFNPAYFFTSPKERNLAGHLRPREVPSENQLTRVWTAARIVRGIHVNWVCSRKKSLILHKLFLISQILRPSRYKKIHFSNRKHQKEFKITFFAPY